MRAVRLRLVVFLVLVAITCVPIAINHVVENHAADPTAEPTPMRVYKNDARQQKLNLDADLRALRFAGITLPEGHH